MNYNYEIERVSAQQGFMRVRYDAEGLPSIRQTFNPTDFSAAALRGLIEQRAGRVVAEWERIQSLAVEVTEVDLGDAVSGSGEYIPPPTPTASPPFDEFTENLVAGVDAETNTQTWTVVPKTQAEIDDYLATWRTNQSVTKRQTMLALLTEGKTEADVQAVIDSFPEPDRTTANVEWQNTSTVDRTSPLLPAIAAAFGWDDAKLDDLFKLAMTL